MSDIQPIEATQSLLFNYSHIDVDTANYLQQNAHETRGLLKRTTEDMIRIGQNLLEAKRRLPHGQFLPWVKAELGISQSTAWRFMQVAQGKAIKKSFTVNDLMEQISAPDEGTQEELIVEAAAAPELDSVELLQKKLEVATTLKEIQDIENKVLKLKSSYSSQDEEVITDGIAYDMTNAEIPKNPVEASICAVLSTGGLLNRLYRDQPLAKVEDFAWIEFHLRPAQVSQYMLYASRFPREKGMIPKQIADDIVALNANKHETVNLLIEFFARRKEALPYLMDIARCFMMAKFDRDRKGKDFNSWVVAKYHLPVQVATTLVDLLEEYATFPFEDIGDGLAEAKIDAVAPEFVWRCADIFVRYELYNLDISMADCIPA